MKKILFILLFITGCTENIYYNTLTEELVTTSECTENNSDDLNVFDETGIPIRYKVYTENNSYLNIALYTNKSNYDLYMEQRYYCNNVICNATNDYCRTDNSFYRFEQCTIDRTNLYKENIIPTNIKELKGICTNIYSNENGICLYHHINDCVIE